MHTRTVETESGSHDIRAGGPESGDAVLVIPDAADDIAIWDAIAERLHTSDLRTVVLGTEIDSTADVIAVLDAMSIGWANVACHRSGGPLGFTLAARAPGRVVSLVAIDAPHPSAAPDSSDTPCPPVEVRTTLVVSDQATADAVRSSTRFVYGDVRVTELAAGESGGASADWASAVATEIVMRTSAW